MGAALLPFDFVGPKRLHPVPLPQAALGPVDVVVISHDHYDHLDLPTIKKLAGTDTLFAVPLGVGAHLERWGVSPDRLRELDWNESTRVGGLTLTATPARHFCGRGIRNRQHTLWASWVVAGENHRIYHSGDTGYFHGFKDIGAEHGPFDATMIQIGAYSDMWPDIHMTPEEGVDAHVDLQNGDAAAGVLLPIHWGTFNLAPHPWAEPGERTMWAAHRAGARIVAPRPGNPSSRPRSEPSSRGGARWHGPRPRGGGPGPRWASPRSTRRRSAPEPICPREPSGSGADRAAGRVLLRQLPFRVWQVLFCPDALAVGQVAGAPAAGEGGHQVQAAAALVGLADTADAGRGEAAVVDLADQ